MPLYPKMNRGDMTLRQFSKRFNVSMSTAARMTSDSRESYLRKAHERHEQIFLLRQQEQLSYRQIAARTGMSVASVHYALAKMGALDTPEIDIPETSE